MGGHAFGTSRGTAHALSEGDFADQSEGVKAERTAERARHISFHLRCETRLDFERSAQDRCLGAAP